MTVEARITRRAAVRRLVASGAALAATNVRLPAGEASPSATPSDTEWRIGIYTRPWDAHDWRVALDAMVEAGFRYAGLMTTRSESRLVISAATTLREAEVVSREVERRGLKVLSVYGGGIPVARSRKEGADALRRLIDACATVGSETLLMGGIGSKELYDAYYGAIADCVAHAEERKVGITLKPHGGLNATGPQCRRAVELVGHRGFRLWYDPGNIYYYSDGKLDPVKDAASVDGLVTGMCVKDYRHPRDVMVTPGDGRVDFAGVLARLRRGGLRGGPLVIETLSRGEPPQLVAEARRAKAFVERLVRDTDRKSSPDGE